MVKKIIFLIAIITIGGISGIMADRYLFPYLITTKAFSRYEILKKSTQDVTIINKTEQVYVKEESSIGKLAAPTVSSVVNIISLPNPDTKNPKFSPQSGFRNGTGIIATSDGLIMTYISSINPENSLYKIMLSDGNIYDGKLMEIDLYSGLAFIKISASNLPVISFGDSNSVGAGEKIISIGNSQENQGPILGTGVISSFDPFYNISGKPYSVPEKMEGVFRESLAFSNLYVGGPVVNYSGETIAIIGSTERDGVIEYFAIPSNVAKIVLEKAIRNELGSSPSLGLYYVPLNRSTALFHRVEQEKGALVYSPSGQQGLAVISGSSAAKADIRIKDVITKVDDEEISEKNNLPQILYRHKRGDKIRITVIRNNQEMVLEAEL